MEKDAKVASSRGPVPTAEEEASKFGTWFAKPPFLALHPAETARVKLEYHWVLRWRSGVVDWPATELIGNGEFETFLHYERE